MTFYVSAPLIAFFIDVALIFLVLRSNFRARINRICALFLLTMAIWTFSIFGMRSTPNLESSLWWDRSALFTAPLMAILFYHLTLELAHIKPRKWLLPTAYGVSITLSCLALTPLLIIDMQLKPSGYAPTYSILLPFFFSWAYAFVFFAIITLVRFYKASSDYNERRQAILIITGAVLSLLCGAIDIFRSFGLKVPPMLIIGNIVFGCLVTVAILRYRFLNIPQVIRKTLTYALASGLAAGIYVILIFLTNRFFKLGEISLAFNVILILAIAIALRPVLASMQKMVDKRFYRERYNQLSALKQFSKKTHDVTDLDRLSSSLVGLTKQALRSHSVWLLMPRGRKGDFTLAAGTAPAPPTSRAGFRANGPIVRSLRTEAEFLSRKHIHINPKLQALSAGEIETVNQLDAELLVALRRANDLAGILVLSPKVSGEAYSQDDESVLTVVSQQVSTALDNARLYNEVQEALRELQKTQDRLLQTERLRAVGEVAAGVGHDLRNLLTVALGRAQLALERVQDNGKLKHDLQVIEQAALDGAEVVNRLQSFTKVGGNLSFNLVDMNRLLLDALQMVKPRLSQQREMANMTTDVIVNLGEAELVKGKPSELREMLTNILVNAIEAMPRGGKLTITSRQENDSVVISIEDTGVGIASKARKRIFEPFYTTKGHQGVGLGLSIAYSVAKRHGGDIRMSSKLGKGSTFTIRLPITKQRRMRQAVSGKARRITRRKTAALIIDDDKVVGEVLSEVLESGGYSVDLATSGKEGLALAQRKDYAVVITDLGMPGMSGRDVARAINTVKPATPIFLITGWDVELRPAELIEWGVTGVITKPFTRSNILAQIKRTIWGGRSL